jgi:type IV fimbrial biogenesis protein FimT
VKTGPFTGYCAYPKNTQGFTLVEAIVVIAILGIFIALAAPNFSSAIANMHMKSTSFDLVNDLNTARSEAIKRNSNVVISATSNDWNQGWSIVAGTVTLKTHEAISSNIELDANANSITFQGNGRTSAAVQISITSTLSGTTARCIELQVTGSARSVKEACLS